MGHLSDYMMGYYVRPKDTYQENIQYSEKVIREIAGENITPLGGNMLGEEIKANIKTRNRTLEEQFEKIQAELNGQKMSHKIVMIDKSDVN